MFEAVMAVANVVPAVPVARLIGVTPPAPSETRAVWPSGVIAIPFGPADAVPSVIALGVPVVLVAMLIGITQLPALDTT